MIPRRLFWLIDSIAIACAFIAAYIAWPTVHIALNFVRLDWLPPTLRPVLVTAELPPLLSASWVVFLAASVSIATFELSDAYRPLLHQTRARIFVTSFLAPLASAGIIGLVLFFQRSAWSRLYILLFIGFAAATLAVIRMSLRQYFERRRAAGFYTKHVLLVGPRDVVSWLSVYFREIVPVTEYRVAGYVSIPDDRTVAENGAPQLLGPVDELGDMLINERIDEVVAVQPHKDAEWLPAVIANCDSLGILLRIVPQGLLFGTTRVLRTLYPLQVLHLPAVVLTPPHFDSDAVFFKRVFDIIVSAMLLLLLSPLFLAIAIAIKLSDPKSKVFYRWNVVGRNGVRFTGFKFTTMCSDADLRRDDLLGMNEMTGPVFKIKNDPRVTPLGRLLRKYSLNELPQLWSVLRGDMSLVGPRPAFPHELRGYGFWQKRKLSIRPGITCLWQVRGRNRISEFDDWVKMDLEYIDNWSLWLDVKILARTVWAVVAGTGS